MPRTDLLDQLLTPGLLPEREAKALRIWAGTLPDYQREWVFEPAQFAIANKGRQLGFSFATAGAAVVWGAFLGETTVLISRSDPQAAEVLSHAEKCAKLLEAWGSTWARHAKNATRIWFRPRVKGGTAGRIITSVSERGAQGFTGNVVLDEFAYHEHPNVAWDASVPAATLVGGKVRVLSTPNGVGNFFHDLWSNPERNKGWAKHQVDVHEALSRGLNPRDGGKVLTKEEFLAKAWTLTTGDARKFAQSYECSFLDGELQYLRTEDVDAAMVGGRPPILLDAESYLGVDFGRTRDLTIALVLQRDLRTGLLWEVACREVPRTDFEEQVGTILNLVDVWKPRRICLDRGGIGRMPSENIRRRLGRGRVEELDFTKESKDELATGLYSAFADRQLRLQASEDMRRDLLSIQRIITAAGNVTYDAPRTEHGHADRAWALALALRASKALVGRRRESGPGQYGNA